jgi:hypothetical protein
MSIRKRQRYSVNRYESERATDADSGLNAAVTLHSMNPAFAPIVLRSSNDDRLKVLAEFVDVVA